MRILFLNVGFTVEVREISGRAHRNGIDLRNFLQSETTVATNDVNGFTFAGFIDQPPQECFCSAYRERLLPKVRPGRRPVSSGRFHRLEIGYNEAIVHSIRARDRDLEGDAGAFVGLGINFAGAADFGKAFAHVLEAVFCVGGAGGGLGRRKAAAVVFDDEFEGGGLVVEGDADFGGAGVFDGVVEGFFEGEENVVADLGGQGPRRDADGEIEAAADVGRVEKILREFSEVGGEAVKGVVARVDGPDDFVEGASEVARGVVDAVEIFGRHFG